MASKPRNPEARANIDEAIETLVEANEILMWLHKWKNVESSSLPQSNDLQYVLMCIFSNLPDAIDQSVKNVLTRARQSDSGVQSGNRWRDE